MRPVSSIVFVSALLALASPAHARTFVGVGVGLPELLHAEIGAFVTDRVSVQLVGGVPLFNPLVGVGASWLALGAENGGRPPSHAFVLTGEWRVNPRRPISLVSAGDRLGSALGLYGGYSYVADAGLLVRVQGGPIFIWEDGAPGAGVNAFAMIGWVF